MDAAAISEREFLGLDTGLSGLNRLTGGWMPDDLIVLAARPSIGKTALALSMALSAAETEGVGVGIFSLEMSKIQVMQRMICLLAPIELQRLRSGKLTAGERTSFAEAANKLAGLPIFIDDTAGLEVAEMRARAERLRQRHKIGLWIIDYMQLMRSGNGRLGKREEVGYVSNGLKALAKETQTPVIALSQLSRAPEERNDKKPQLSDLRETGEIEQDADLVLLIHRPGKYGIKGLNGESLEGEAELIVDKYRNGETGIVSVAWLPERAKFADLQRR
jgi:replicative DNA helicase